MGKFNEIMRQFHIPRNSPLANKSINYMKRKYGIKISILSPRKCEKLIPGIAISVTGIDKKVHRFVGDIFEFNKGK